MIPKFPRMRPLSWEDRTQLAERLYLCERTTCEYNVTHFFLWEDRYTPHVTMIDGMLCVRFSPPDEAPYFLEPLGEGKCERAVDVCLQHTCKLSRLSEQFVSALPQNQYNTISLPNHYDYIYSRDSLATLKGRKFDGKRNHIHRFSSQYPNYRYEQLTPEHRDSALEVFDKWFSAKKLKQEMSNRVYTSRQAAIGRAFDRFHALNITGGVIIIDGVVHGFLLGSAVSETMMCVHFHYAFLGIQGLFQVLFWEACRNTFTHASLINLEQDRGLPGLRQAKESYHPLRQEKKYDIVS